MADEYCRICLRSSCTLMGPEPMYSMFNVYRSVATDKMFTYVTGLVITQEDNLPHHICSQCFSSLTLAFALKIQSEKANKWLLDNVPKQTTQISGTDTSKNTQHNVPLKRQRTDDCEALADNATENRADHNEVSDSGDEEEQNVVKEETPIKAMELETDKDSVNTASTSYPMIRVKTIPKEDETGLQECRICNKEFLPSEIKQHMKLKCGKDLQAVKQKAVLSRRQCIECHKWCINTRDLINHRCRTHTHQSETDAEHAGMHQKKPIQFKVSQIKMKDSDVAKGNARSVLKQKVSNFSDNDISAIVSDVNTDCEVVLIDEDDF